MAKFEKGQSGNPQGKTIGTQNRTTLETKKFFNEILNGEVDNIKDSFDKVRTESPYRYLIILAKYLNYVYPKGLELRIDEQKESNIDLSKLSTDELKARLKAFQENKNIVILPCNCKEGKENAENLKNFMED